MIINKKIYLIVFFVSISTFIFGQLSVQKTYTPNDPGTSCSDEETVWPDPSSFYPCCAGAATGTTKVINSNGGSIPNYTYRIASVEIYGLNGVDAQVRQGVGSSVSTVFKTSNGSISTQNNFTRSTGNSPYRLNFWFNFKLSSSQAGQIGISGTAYFRVEYLSNGSWNFAFTMSAPIRPLQAPYLSGNTVGCGNGAIAMTIKRNNVPPRAHCNINYDLTWTITNGWKINGSTGTYISTNTTVNATKGSSSSNSATLCVSHPVSWYIPNNQVCKTIQVTSTPSAPTDIYLSSPNYNCTWNTAASLVAGATSYTWSGYGPFYTSTNASGPDLPQNNSYYMCVRANNSCGSSSYYCEWITTPTAPISSCQGGYRLAPDRPAIANSEIQEHHQPQLDIKVFPNPVTSTLFVSLPANGEPYQLSIRDAQGKKIQKINTTDSKLEVDVRTLPDGLYYLEIIGNSYRKTKSIVVQK